MSAPYSNIPTGPTMAAPPPGYEYQSPYNGGVQPVYQAPGGPGYQGPPPPFQNQAPGGVVYVAVQSGEQQVVDNGDVNCAQIGCFFSWIPIVGCINWCANNGAPEGSKRRKLAQTSCYIALGVFIRE